MAIPTEALDTDPLELQEVNSNIDQGDDETACGIDEHDQQRIKEYLQRPSWDRTTDDLRPPGDD